MMPLRLPGPQFLYSFKPAAVNRPAAVVKNKGFPVVPPSIALAHMLPKSRVENIVIVINSFFILTH